MHIWAANSFSELSSVQDRNILDLREACSISKQVTLSPKTHKESTFGIFRKKRKIPVLWNVSNDENSLIFLDKK